MLKGRLQHSQTIINSLLHLRDQLCLFLLASLFLQEKSNTTIRGEIHKLKVTQGDLVNIPARAVYLKHQAGEQALLLLHHTPSVTGHTVKRPFYNTDANIYNIHIVDKSMWTHSHRVLALIFLVLCAACL